MTCRVRYGGVDVDSNLVGLGTFNARHDQAGRDVLNAIANEGAADRHGYGTVFSHVGGQCRRLSNERSALVDPNHITHEGTSRQGDHKIRRGVAGGQVRSAARVGRCVQSHRWTYNLEVNRLRSGAERSHIRGGGRERRSGIGGTVCTENHLTGSQLGSSEGASCAADGSVVDEDRAAYSGRDGVG